MSLRVHKVRGKSHDYKQLEEKKARTKKKVQQNWAKLSEKKNFKCFFLKPWNLLYYKT